MKKRVTVFLLAICMIVVMFPVTALADPPTAQDINQYTTTLPTYYSLPEKEPISGYFTKAVGTDRSLKVYIAENAPLRTKITVVAVPDGVDTYTFLSSEGWIELADRYGEIICALEPGAGGWGTQPEEQEYIDNAMAFMTSGCNDNLGSNGRYIPVFAGHSTFYFVGYGGGCAPLESWAAKEPLRIISQVYVGGPGVGQAYLDAVGADDYDGKNLSGYDPGPEDDVQHATLDFLGYQDGEFMTKSQVPVPTWFIGYDENDYSITYWKAANEVLSVADGDVYHQDINAVAFQTQFTNECILEDDPTTPYGMSQVKVSAAGSNNAAVLYGFLSQYIRYTFQFAYSNTLGYRLNYGELLTSLYEQLPTATKETRTYRGIGGETLSYEFWAQDEMSITAPNSTESGTMIAGAVAMMDYNGDGTLDPRQYLIYIPDCADDIWGDQGAPVMMAHGGNLQTSMCFMDASQWWQVANEVGCVVVFVGQTYSSSTGTGNGAGTNLYDYLLEDMLADAVSAHVAIDTTRIYGGGHSSGSSYIQGMGLTNPDLYAAIASTSFPSRNVSAKSGLMMPIYLIHGQSDLPFEMPDLWGNTTLQAWAQDYFDANGLETDINSYTSADTSGRFHTYAWANAMGIDLVKYGYTLLREHNCIPQEQFLAWNFVSKFSFERDADGAVTGRYYSPSGFTVEGDEIPILNDEEASGVGEVGAVVDPSFVITIPTSVNFGTLIKNTGIQEKPFVVTMSDSVLGMGAHVDVNVFSTFLMSAGSATLGYDLFNEAGVQQSNGSTYTSFTADGSDTGKVTVDTAEITQAGAYNGTMLFNFTYVG